MAAVGRQMMKHSVIICVLMQWQPCNAFLLPFTAQRHTRVSGHMSVDDFGFPVHDSDGQLDKRQIFTPPSKGDLYTDEELENLFKLHNQIKDTTSKRSDNQYPILPSTSMHDIVLAALRDIDSLPGKSVNSQKPIDKFALPTVYPVTLTMRNVLPNIRMIASDVDGTLLTSQHNLHPRTARAIELALAATKDPAQPLEYFILATGKSRAGALNSLGSSKLQMMLSQNPGVYLQGLYCVDASGQVIYEKRLASKVVAAAIELSIRSGTSLFCYDGDSIQASTSSSTKHIREFNVRWGEPEPLRVDDNQSLVSFSKGYHKVLLMDDDTDKIRSIRPLVESLAAKFGCVVTQAVSTMLELLPPNSGKEVGVLKLCEALGVQDGERMAIGDGENDIEFLRGAAFAVAVGNAVPLAKDAADLVLMETNNDGGAGVAIELFGLNKIFLDE